MSEALEKMKGKISEIASSHVSSRVLQVIFFYSLLYVVWLLCLVSNVISSLSDLREILLAS